LLADTGFVLEPDFDRLVFGAVGDRGGDQFGEVFMEWPAPQTCR
jgi:hypothetical protein